MNVKDQNPFIIIIYFRDARNQSITKLTSFKQLKKFDLFENVKKIF